MNQKPKIIKCSQCDETFFGGFEYRMHWEKKHLQQALNQIKKNERKKFNRNAK